MTLTGRDFLREADFTSAELDGLINLAASLKAERRAGTEIQRLRGRQLAAIFEKTSTRTRISFEVAMRDQGGHVTVLDGASSQIGHKESFADTARVLARMFDAIEFRGASHTSVEELAAYSDVPVYNGLTDEWHPTQMLADFLTMREHAVDPDAPLRYAYLGDARNNMGNSLLVTGAILGAANKPEVCSDRASHVGVLVVIRRQAVQELRTGVPGQRHGRSVDSVRRQLFDAVGPYRLGLAHRDPDVGVHELRTG
jgi:ornithine carbamoyltransferase